MTRFLKLFWLLLNHPRVSRNKKLLFVALPVIYWLLPDPIPFVFDDLLVLVIGLWSFVKLAKNDIKHKRDSDDVIDVEARVVDDE